MVAVDACYKFIRKGVVSDENSHKRATYERAEDVVLDKMEGILTIVDNAVALQALFPNSRVFKPLQGVLKHASSIYIFMLVMYIKRAVLKLGKINKYIRIVKAEIILGIMAASEVLEKLYREKAKAMIDLVGYVSDFMLNISLIFPKLKLGRFMSRLLGAISWLATIARFLGGGGGDDDGSQDNSNGVLEQVEKRYGNLVV